MLCHIQKEKVDASDEKGAQISIVAKEIVTQGCHQIAIMNSDYFFIIIRPGWE